jgi:phage baseplate assembly protein W|tara:strand:+ start:35 stop:445 length:411 start_codon:yes stop_codon:yes gene_type:complete
MARLVRKIYPVDVDQNTPIGLDFPLIIGSAKQNFVTSQQIHANLKNLIMTMKGERPMQPTFGSDLYNILFEPIDDGQMSDAAATAIKSAVASWMPQVTITRVKVSSRKDQNKIRVGVSYMFDGWPADSVLNLEVKI